MVNSVKLRPKLLKIFWISDEIYLTQLRLDDLVMAFPVSMCEPAVTQHTRVSLRGVGYR